MINTYTIKNIYVMINNETEIMKHVNNYVYLGQQVSTHPSMEEELKHRIRLRWQTYGRESSIFKSYILMVSKRKVYNQCILPTVTIIIMDLKHGSSQNARL